QPRHDENLEAYQDQAQHEKQDGQDGKFTVAPKRMGPEEQDETDGGDHAGKADARHFQFQDQADDANHDQENGNHGMPHELADSSQPGAIGPFQVLVFHAVECANLAELAFLAVVFGLVHHQGYYALFACELGSQANELALVLELAFLEPARLALALDFHRVI